MLKVNFRCHTPKKHTFWEIENLPFFENISFAGLKSKFLSTQQKLYMSPTHPINMSSIGLKLMKIEQIKKVRFFVRSLYCWNHFDGFILLLATNFQKLFLLNHRKYFCVWRKTEKQKFVKKLLLKRTTTFRGSHKIVSAGRENYFGHDWKFVLHWKL